MKKQLFFKTPSNFRLHLTRQARLLIEVFTRENFGERYFRLRHSIIVVIVLGIFPIVMIKLLNFIALAKAGVAPLIAFLSSATGGSRQALSHETGYNGSEVVVHTIVPYIAWYAYLSIFLALSIRHYLDLKREKHVFNFDKYSYDSGSLIKFFDNLFFKIKIPKMETNARTINCFIEPGVFFLAGLALWLVGQNLGMLLMICGVTDCLSSLREYEEGDNMILDKIDERLTAEDLQLFFMEDHVDQDKFGALRLTRQPPSDAAMRREFYEEWIKDRDEAFEVT